MVDTEGSALPARTPVARDRLIVADRRIAAAVEARSIAARYNDTNDTGVFAPNTASDKCIMAGFPEGVAR